MFRSIGLAECVVLGVMILGSNVLALVPLCKITDRTGYPGWWGLLSLLPFGTLLWACFMAFSKWPRDVSPR